MLKSIQIFLFLIVLQCPPSLLIPLPQQDVASTSKNLVVLGTDKIEQVTPNNSIVTELLQQIDVKDNEDHVISNINHVVVSDDNNIQNNNNEIQNNGTNIIHGQNNKNILRRPLNGSNTNNTNEEFVTLKHSTDKSNHITDIKFRTGENQDTQNNINEESHIVHQNNSTAGSNAPDNANLTNSNATVVEISIEDISSAEAPAFRSIIPGKIRKTQKVSNFVNNELNETKDHNLVLKLSRESLPISIELKQIPINNLLGGALTFFKRLKRNTHDKAENSYPWETNCKSKQIDELHTVKSCKKSHSFNNDLTIKTISNRKSFDDTNISNVLRLYDSVELVCPLSVIVKLYTHQVLDNLAKNDPDNVLNRILSSFVKDNEDAINLASKELSDLPIPIKLRLQLVHGKTKEFMEQLSDIVDATLCSLS